VGLEAPARECRAEVWPPGAAPRGRDLLGIGEVADGVDQRPVRLTAEPAARLSVVRAEPFDRRRSVQERQRRRVVRDIEIGRPQEVSTQSTTPLIVSPSNSTLPGWKSRCRKQPRYAGAPTAIAENARSHTSGHSDHAGITRRSGTAHD
jgi:hypothetical protein